MRCSLPYLLNNIFHKLRLPFDGIRAVVFYFHGQAELLAKVVRSCAARCAAGNLLPLSKGGLFLEACPIEVIGNVCFRVLPRWPSRISNRCLAWRLDLVTVIEFGRILVKLWTEVIVLDTRVGVSGIEQASRLGVYISNLDKVSTPAMLLHHRPRSVEILQRAEGDPCRCFARRVREARGQPAAGTRVREAEPGWPTIAERVDEIADLDLQPGAYA